MDSITRHGHLVRRLWPSDLPLFRDHLLRLDPETRHDRFGLAVADAFLNDYAEQCFSFGAITYGYIEDGVMRGAGELRTVETNAAGRITNAEAAFSVEASWRRSGIGTELMARIVRATCNRGVAQLSIFCLAHNRPMLRLAKKFETQLKFESDEVSGRLVARSPSALSLWHELLDDSIGFAAAVLDAQSRILPLGARSEPDGGGAAAGPDAGHQ